jgi:hypothetical protein
MPAATEASASGVQNQAEWIGSDRVELALNEAIESFDSVMEAKVRPAFQGKNLQFSKEPGEQARITQALSRYFNEVLPALKSTDPEVPPVDLDSIVQPQAACKDQLGEEYTVTAARNQVICISPSYIARQLNAKRVRGPAERIIFGHIAFGLAVRHGFAPEDAAFVDRFVGQRATRP